MFGLFIDLSELLIHSQWYLEMLVGSFPGPATSFERPTVCKCTHLCACLLVSFYHAGRKRVVSI